MQIMGWSTIAGMGDDIKNQLTGRKQNSLLRR